MPRATTKRQKEVLEALRALIPLAPLSDFEPIVEATRQPHFRTLQPKSAAWLALVAHIRHRYTDYDRLMDDGYDKDSARFFVLDETNDQLAEWGSATRLNESGERI
ncbi:MAG: DUF2293 domain-containing protein [Pseudomonadota bacterium]